MSTFQTMNVLPVGVNLEDYNYEFILWVYFSQSFFALIVFSYGSNAFMGVLGLVVGIDAAIGARGRGSRPVNYLTVHCSDLGQVVDLSLSVA